MQIVTYSRRLSDRLARLNLLARVLKSELGIVLQHLEALLCMRALVVDSEHNDLHVSICEAACKHACALSEEMGGIAACR